MRTLLDPKLRKALENDGAAQSLLNELHQQIVGRPHPRLLSELLAKYVATATARGGAADFQLRLQDAMQKQQDAVQMLSSIMKNFHDTAKNIIQNLRG